MATPVLISEQEYLRSTFRPDCDLVEGEVLERNVGETQHSAIQIFVGSLFQVNRQAWRLRVFPEQRIQVAPRRYRIADLCVIPLNARPGPILRTPPLLCIEVLSSSQSFADIQPRAQDYQRMGVPQIWLLDPKTRRCFVWRNGDFQPGPEDVLRMTGSEAAIPLPEMWAELDGLGADEPYELE